MSLPAPTVEDKGEGIKIVTEYKYDDDGNKIKVTRKVKVVLSLQKTNHASAERKKWKKFGSALRSGGDSFKDGTTTICEAVILKLSISEDGGSNDDKDESSAPLKKLKSTIVCRTCKGDHWTHKCPYKNTLKPLDDLLSSKEPSNTENNTDKVEKKSKYVPPALREGASSVAASAGASISDRASFRSRDDPCIRVSSLSEETREQDLYDLFGQFGSISRAFLATDKNSGRCKGFAFITYREKEGAQKAIQVMNGHGYDNLILKVEWSQRD